MLIIRPGSACLLCLFSLEEGSGSLVPLDSCSPSSLEAACLPLASPRDEVLASLAAAMSVSVKNSAPFTPLIWMPSAPLLLGALNTSTFSSSVVHNSDMLELTTILLANSEATASLRSSELLYSESSAMSSTLTGLSVQTTFLSVGQLLRASSIILIVFLNDWEAISLCSSWLENYLMFVMSLHGAMTIALLNGLSLISLGRTSSNELLGCQAPGQSLVEQ